jgi:hypothetical protein
MAIRIEDIKEFKNTKIEKFHKDLELNNEPLSETEFSELKKLLKTIDPSQCPVSFAGSQLIIGKLPDNLKIREMTSGADQETIGYSIPLIVGDQKWVSMVTNDGNIAQSLMELSGATIAVVGKLKTSVKNEKEYQSIRYIRGILVITEKEDKQNGGKQEQKKKL